MTLVVDASITLAWTHTSPSPEAIYAQERLLTEDAIVPSIWPAEVANALLVAERRGLLTGEQRVTFLALLQKWILASKRPARSGHSVSPLT